MQTKPNRVKLMTNKGDNVANVDRVLRQPVAEDIGETMKYEPGSPDFTALVATILSFIDKITVEMQRSHEKEIYQGCVLACFYIINIMINFICIALFLTKL